MKDNVEQLFDIVGVVCNTFAFVSELVEWQQGLPSMPSSRLKSNSGAISTLFWGQMKEFFLFFFSFAF